MEVPSLHVPKTQSQNAEQLRAQRKNSQTAVTVETARSSSYHSQNKHIKTKGGYCMATCGYQHLKCAYSKLRSASKYKNTRSGMVVQEYNSSSQDVEAGGL
jgi:hypothetical protein